MKDLFEQIDEEQIEMPKLHALRSKVSTKRNLNLYQIVSLIVMAVMFVVGIILGNVFPACGETSNLFSTCTKTEYNLSLTIIVWASSFLFCLFLYGFGQIITLLAEINQKLGKVTERGKEGMKNGKN